MKNIAKNTKSLKLITFIFIVILLSQALLLEDVQAYYAGGYNYYDQLNSLEKSVYNEIKKISPSDTVSDTVIELTDIFKDITGETTDDISDMLTDYTSNSMSAILADYPEIFWFDRWQTSFGYEQSSDSSVWSITSVKITLLFKDVYSDNTNEMVNDMLNVINNFNAPGSTRYEKLKHIHDWLADNVVYDLNAPYAHEPYGALVDGRAVCEGYAESFKLLCDKYSIPCILVVGYGVNGGTGEPHKWNYVQMENGKWYAVDVTWDDQGSKVYYDFFLVGADSIPDHFRKIKFSQSHVESGNFLSMSEKTFNYPSLSKTAYISSDPGASPTVSPTKTPSPSKTPTQTKTPAPSTSTPKPSVSKTPVPSLDTTPPMETSPSNPGTSPSEASTSPGVTESPDPSGSTPPESIDVTSTMEPTPAPSDENNFSPGNTDLPTTVNAETIPYGLVLFAVLSTIAVAGVITGIVMVIKRR